MDIYGTGAGPQAAPFAQADTFDLALHILALQDDQTGADSDPEVVKHEGIELVGAVGSVHELVWMGPLE